ncbi:MAG: acetoacetate--CoA ligase [Hyphomicrobiaceae bacterium]
MSAPLWQPSPKHIDDCRLSAFARQLETALGRTFATYEDLHRFSVDQPDQFWRQVWHLCGVVGEMGAGPYLERGEGIEGTRFFPNASLNFAENLLQKDGDGTALVFCGEGRVEARMSWRDLRSATSRLQQALRAHGVVAGDRVAAILPNMPEAVVAMLATASIGATFSSCSPDFGTRGVLDRFGQIEPKVLIACDGYYYNGKPIDISGKLAEICRELPCVKRVIVASYLGTAAEAACGLPNAGTWQDEVLARPVEPLTFERLAFAHPLYILFSSGTTGAPKCIVHSAGGTLLKHLTEHQLHSDLKEGDRLFYFTTLGWMMWNWLVTGLASGATLVLYDGSPFHPDGNALFDLAQREKVTHFGTSAKFIDSVKKTGLRPRDTHDLSAMRAILSTGSPLAPESFEFVYDAIHPTVHLASVSGGTDIVGCFVIGIPTKPVWRGEIQGPALGVAADVVDEDGKPLALGKGELVCTAPFPSMPIGFWNDPDGRKYHDAYFARFPGIWHHGDFAEWTSHGGMIIHGRSDATLNPGGVRIGTAEIYRQVEQLPEVQESIVIGQSWDNDVRIVLFVVMKPGHTLDEALTETIRRRIRQEASPRHVPARVVAVKDIPRTKSGKITELAVRDIVHGRDVKNREALANPEALELFRNLPELTN